MRNFICIILTCISILSSFSQTQLEIWGSQTSPDTVVKINAGVSDAEVVGLFVQSSTGENMGIAGVFTGGNTGLLAMSEKGTAVSGISNSGSGIQGYSHSGMAISGVSVLSSGVVGSSTSSTGVTGNSTDGVGILGSSSSGAGVEGGSESNYGVRGGSLLNYGIYGQSANKAGGFFTGNEISIELGVTNSIFDGGFDDAVIHSQVNQDHSDMILVSNDEIILHLNENNDSDTSSLRILNGGNTEILKLDQNGNLILNGSCSCSSDYSKKENFKVIPDAHILTGISSLAISEWQFKGETTRHFGPMAQDFHKVFGLGNDQTRISSGDLAGVTLAAVQILIQENQKLKERLEFLEEHHRKTNKRKKSNAVQDN